MSDLDHAGQRLDIAGVEADVGVVAGAGGRRVGRLIGHFESRSMFFCKRSEPSLSKIVWSESRMAGMELVDNLDKMKKFTRYFKNYTNTNSKTRILF